MGQGRGTTAVMKSAAERQGGGSQCQEVIRCETWEDVGQRTKSRRKKINQEVDF